MNNEIKMSVSSMTRSNDSKGIYVLFTDGKKSAEFVVPGIKIINNNGFSDEEMPKSSETAKLLEVVYGEDVEKMDTLLSLAITGGDYAWI